MSPQFGNIVVLMVSQSCFPNSKVYGANVGPTWGRQDPGGPQVGHMNYAIWVHMMDSCRIPLTEANMTIADDTTIVIRDF